VRNEKPETKNKNPNSPCYTKSNKTIQMGLYMGQVPGLGLKVSGLDSNPTQIQ